MNSTPVRIEFRAHPQAKVVGLSAKQLRVNRVHELADAIETLGAGRFVSHSMSPSGRAM
jgi:hypothetical protein